MVTANHSSRGYQIEVSHWLVLKKYYFDVRPEKFLFLEKEQNRNFGYKIVISVKNPKFILWILDDEMDFTVGIVSRNLASM